MQVEWSQRQVGVSEWRWVAREAFFSSPGCLMSLKLTRGERSSGRRQLVSTVDRSESITACDYAQVSMLHCLEISVWTFWFKTV